jgi:cytochrome c oxidase assembly protein subunit 15
MSKSQRAIYYWLISGCVLIFLMVVVGGITRLTGSGLSITDWKIVTGTLPPLTENQWQQEFNSYQQTPQYKLVNAHFELNDFKGIYWWEYIHRLLGRLIGIVFIIPFIIFYMRHWIDKWLMPKLIVIFLLGGLQGFLGWYMVKSGLLSQPNVSHIRLAMHLVNALITFAYTYWVACMVRYGNIRQSNVWIIGKGFITTLIILLFAQITYGAFVAGLKAGMVYNTWPKMDGVWLAESVTYSFSKNGFSSLIYNLASVQFIHRTCAVLLFLCVVVIWLKGLSMQVSVLQKNLNILLLLVFIQFALGVFTLIFRVPLVLGVLHQAGAFVLLGAGLHIWYMLYYGSNTKASVN